MDIVLGVSMAPTSVRTLLVEGENADGVTVEDDKFVIAADDAAATLSAADQVVSAILGTREGATQAGHALTSTGVTWTDPVDAAALREALATRKIENVMLVSAFMAAAALAQMVGSATGNAHTALLFVEPDTATLAVVDSGRRLHHRCPQRTDFRRGHRRRAGRDARRLGGLETHPQSVFIVGSGVDVATIKPQLEAVTTLPVSAPEEPETALAWGAALASANAPLFASSTAALAYAQDPATGDVDPYAVSPGYLGVPDVPPGTELGEEDLAYSAVPDEEAEPTRRHEVLRSRRRRASIASARPLLLVGTILGGGLRGRGPGAGSFTGAWYSAERRACCPDRCKTSSSRLAGPAPAPAHGKRPCAAGQSHASTGGGAAAPAAGSADSGSTARGAGHPPAPARAADSRCAAAGSGPAATADRRLRRRRS